MAPRSKRTLAPKNEYVATRGIACRLSAAADSKDFDRWWYAQEGDSLQDAPDHIDLAGLLEIDAIALRDDVKARQDAENGPDGQEDGIAPDGPPAAPSGPGRAEIDEEPAAHDE